MKIPFATFKPMHDEIRKDLPSIPIHAMSVMLYAVERKEDAMIGSASSARVRKIGPDVRFNCLFFMFCP